MILTYILCRTGSILAGGWALKRNNQKDGLLRFLVALVVA